MVQRASILGGRWHPEAFLNEGHIVFSHRPELLVTEDGVGPGASSEHHAVPGGQNLVVTMGAHSAGKHRTHGSEGFLEQRSICLGYFGLGEGQHVESRQGFRIAVVDEVALARDAEPGCDHVEGFGAEQPRQFSLGPAVEFPFLTFAVGILGRIKPAVRVGHVVGHIAQNVPGNVGMPGLAGNQERLEVEDGQLGVVVEHLLEVRHEPPFIDAVSGETTAQVISDASGGHVVTGRENRLNRLGIAESAGIP